MLPRRLALPLLLCMMSCGGGSAGSETSSSGSETAATSDAPTSMSAPTTSSASSSSTGEGDPCTTTPQALADCVDAEAYAEDLRFIADLRTPGTPHWQAVQDLCADRLAEAGFAVTLQDFGMGMNVVGRRVGSTKPEEIVVVGAHYDHIADCHGADDNASGVAATLEIARLLGKVEFERTIVVACWDAEEDGLLGSKAFVAAAVAAKEKIVVDFNFDMIGYTSSAPGSQRVPPGFEAVFPALYAELDAKGFTGDFIAIVISSLTHDYALTFAAAAVRVGLAAEVIEIPQGAENTVVFDDLRRSDHAAFWEAGFPALFITDTGEFRNEHYHCMKGPDEVADLDLEFAVGVTRATVEAAAVTLGM